MRQIFIPKNWIDLEKRRAVLLDDSFHHLVHVLRKQKGQQVEAFDGHGGAYRARISEVLHDRAVLEILDVRVAPQESREKKFILTLAAAILKEKAMHWLIQKVTEVGVQTIVPLVTHRTVCRPKGDSRAKVGKWEKIAVEAAKQCGRTFVPNILHPVRWQDFLPHTGDFDARLLAWEGKPAPPLGAWVTQTVPLLKSLDRPANVLLLVGPEGGFEPAEVEQARRHGFSLFSMGENILRSETAAVVASALVLYELNR